MNDSIIPPYFSKISPELINFNWDPYLNRVKNTNITNLKDFDKIFLHHDIILDDQVMNEVIDYTNNLYYHNVYFLEYYKGKFIQRHEKLFGNIDKLKSTLFEHNLS